MPIAPGPHTLGPDNATLVVKTGRRGAAAKAGHDLVIHVTSWSATLEVGAEPGQATIELDADARSLRVREGTGGIQSLGEDDKASIQQTIDDDVLKGRSIQFRSSQVQAGPDGGHLTVEGELTLGDVRRPITFELAIDGDGRLTGSAVVNQTDWSIKPYSALFGALKVADEVEVLIDAGVPLS